MADRRNQRSQSRVECEEIGLLRAIRSARTPQDRADRHPDGQAYFARLAASSRGRQAALPARDHAARHGYLQRKDLDQNRIGVFGRSFGSYAATVLSNAIAERLCGVVVGLPCFEPGFTKIFEEASPTYKNRFMFMAGYEDEAEFDKFTQGFDLRTRVSNLRCPFMVLGGELDELSPIKHVFEVCKKVPGPVEIVVYQNERHAPGRLPSSQRGPHWYAVMADWLAARVRDRTPIEGRHYRYVTASGKVEQRPML